ncbi:MAG TPA: hypothetical protein VLF21_01450 [Candidatus Saccharimonadales bacterium]|nr:hypothetical protein [Candidatus Saccharimonadales bacterium]
MSDNLQITIDKSDWVRSRVVEAKKYFDGDTSAEGALIKALPAIAEYIAKVRNGETQDSLLIQDEVGGKAKDEALAPGMRWWDGDSLRAVLGISISPGGENSLHAGAHDLGVAMEEYSYSAPWSPGSYRVELSPPSDDKNRGTSRSGGGGAARARF